MQTGQTRGMDEMTTRGLAPAGGVCPRIRGMDGWVDAAPRILLRGVDTLYFSFDVAVSDATYAALLAEQHRARMAVRECASAAYCSDWLQARVLPSGAKGYGVLLEAEGWTIKVQKGNRTRPPIYVEMRAFTLHTHPGGVEGASRAACAYVRDVLLADQPEEARSRADYGRERLSRLDLHLDWQGGWRPTLAEQERRQFVKPGHAKLNGHLEGDACTGYDVGKRRVMARVYDKTIQATGKHLDWYFALLRATAGAAYNPEQHVWRLEFELKREGITGFRLQATPEAEDPDEALDAELEAEDLPSVGTIRKALRWAEQLWRYLTTRWLRLVVPSGDANRARWPTHPTWRVLQAGFMGAFAPGGSENDEEAAGHGDPPTDEARLRLVRAHRHSGYARLVTRMGLGIASTAEAMLHTDPASVLPAYLDNVRRIARRAAEHQRAKRETGRARRSAGAELRYQRYVRLLAEMALGAFAAEGVVKAELPPIADVAGLLCCLVDDLEAVAREKGGVGQLLHDKWCKLYKANPPRGLFRPAGARRRGWRPRAWAA